MVDKDSVEAKIDETKERIDEKVDEHRQRSDARRERNRERFDDTRERSREFTDKMSSDISRSIEDLKESIKNMQKYADDKINDYKQSTVQSLDVELVESDDTYYVKVAVPGLEKEEVEINAGDNDVVITTTFKPLIEELEDVEGETIRSELKVGKCSKTITFENSIDLEKTTAKFNKGIVIITLPKLIIPKHKINVE